MTLILPAINRYVKVPWRCGIVVIASAYRTKDPGFETHHGVKFLGIYTLHNLIRALSLCVLEKKINEKTDPCSTCGLH
jgi:hypothetical protein